MLVGPLQGDLHGDLHESRRQCRFPNGTHAELSGKQKSSLQHSMTCRTKTKDFKVDRATQGRTFPTRQR